MQFRKTINFLLIILVISIALAGCANNGTEESANNSNGTPPLDEEIENWKTSLKADGKVGEPCEGGIEEWTKNNPNLSFGMGDVKKETFDINGDGVDDALAHFYTESCNGGHAFGTFACLIVSEEGNYRSNADINAEVEDKINEYLKSNNLTEVRNSYIEFTEMKETLNGEFTTWMNDDANCCASFAGEFQYNPMDQTLTASHAKLNHEQ